MATASKLTKMSCGPKVIFFNWWIFHQSLFSRKIVISLRLNNESLLSIIFSLLNVIIIKIKQINNLHYFFDIETVFWKYNPNIRMNIHKISVPHTQRIYQRVAHKWTRSNNLKYFLKLLVHMKLVSKFPFKKLSYWCHPHSNTQI